MLGCIDEVSVPLSFIYCTVIAYFNIQRHKFFFLFFFKFSVFFLDLPFYFLDAFFFFTHLFGYAPSLFYLLKFESFLKECYKIFFAAFIKFFKIAKITFSFYPLFLIFYFGSCVRNFGFYILNVMKKFFEALIYIQSTFVNVSLIFEKNIFSVGTKFSHVQL